MKIQVYRNLHKKCLSVRQSGKVVKHVQEIRLKNVKFKVSEKSRQRVLREKRKNVHAWIEGEETDEIQETKHQIYYNPYKYSTFIYLENEVSINESTYVHIKGSQIYAI